MDKEGIVSAIKKVILPELEAIKGNQAKMDVRLDAIEKRIADMNGHLVDQSRRIDNVRTELTAKIDDVRTELITRIDATNSKIDDVRTELITRIDATNSKVDDVKTELTARIDGTNSRIDDVKTELTARIDGTNSRIDQLTFQVGKVAQEMERIKREQVVTADIFTRLQSLETKTARL